MYNHEIFRDFWGCKLQRPILFSCQ